MPRLVFCREYINALSEMNSKAMGRGDEYGIVVIFLIASVSVRVDLTMSSLI